MNWLVRINRSLPAEFGKTVSCKQNFDVVIIGNLQILWYSGGYEIY